MQIVICKIIYRTICLIHVLTSKIFHFQTKMSGNTCINLQKRACCGIWFCIRGKYCTNCLCNIFTYYNYTVLTYKKTHESQHKIKQTTTKKQMKQFLISRNTLFKQTKDLLISDDFFHSVPHGIHYLFTSHVFILFYCNGLISFVNLWMQHLTINLEDLDFVSNSSINMNFNNFPKLLQSVKFLSNNML